MHRKAQSCVGLLTSLAITMLQVRERPGDRRQAAPQGGAQQELVALRQQQAAMQRELRQAAGQRAQLQQQVVPGTAAAGDMLLRLLQQHAWPPWNLLAAYAWGCMLVHAAAMGCLPLRSLSCHAAGADTGRGEFFTLV